MTNIIIGHGKKAGKSFEGKVDDFFQLLIGEARPSNEFFWLQGLIVELNRACDNIFRIAGKLFQATMNFLGGEPDQNGRTRGEAPHVDNT